MEKKLQATISADAAPLKRSVDEATAKIQSDAAKWKKAIDQAGNSMRVAGVGFKDLQGAFSGGAASMGASFAIIGKGIESIGVIIKEVNRLMQEEAEYARQSAKRQNEDMAKAHEANERRRKSAEALLEKLDELNSVEDKTNAQMEQQAQLVRQLSKGYGDLGMEIDAATGKIVNFDEVMERKLAKDRERKLQELQAQLAGLRAEDQRLADDIEKAGFHVWGTDIQIGGRATVEKAQDRRNELTDKINALVREIHDLEQTDPAGDYRRMAEVKRKDAEAKKAAEQQKAAEKRAAEKQKADEEYDKQLNKWLDNQLENEKQLAKARQDASAKEMELAVWLEEETARRRKAYEDAWQAEKDLAAEQKRQAQADRRARRLERLAGRLSAFGFSLAEGFTLRDDPQARRDRKYNLAVDSSISEKLAARARGERVQFTSRERRRIGEYQGISGEAKSLEAADRQMQAAEKQQQAAEAMAKAVEARNSAMESLTGARGEYARKMEDIRRALEDFTRGNMLVKR